MAQGNNRMRRVSVILLPALVALGGCEGLSSSRQAELEQQRNAAVQRSEELTRQVEFLSARLQEQQKRIETLQALGPKRLKNLFTVESVAITRHSGGVDRDRQPGHDAVLVFLRPLDQDGHVLKAAGDVKIQLFDLAQPEDRTLFAEYTYPVEDIGRYWAGGLLASQYRFECAFPGHRPPEHPEVNLRVTFVDYLTGKTFTAQKILRLALPPKETSATAPATQPAGQE